MTPDTQIIPVDENEQMFYYDFAMYNILLYNESRVEHMGRVILHSDMNSFYASVECLYHPEVRDKPVAVAGVMRSATRHHTCENQHAKKYGIQTGEAIWQGAAHNARI